MTDEEQLSMAIYLAAGTHIDQFDKGGKPYILHPLHLMQQMLFDLQLATIAVLHDVIEDGDITIESLLYMKFSPRVCDALGLLTHDKADDYLNVYIPNICKNFDAVRVKRKDLEHNSSITRLKGVTKKDLIRIEKYHSAFIILTKAKRDFIKDLE